MSEPVVEKDFLYLQDAEFNVIEVIEGLPGEKGDKGDQGEIGPGFPITLYRRGVVPVVNGRMKYRFPVAATLIGISAAMGDGTPPIGSDLVVVINVNGIPRVTLTVPDGAEDVPEEPLNIAVAVGDYLTADITEVGSTSPGEDLSVFIRYDV